MPEGARQFQTVPDSEARRFTPEEIEYTKSAFENVAEAVPETPQAPESVVAPVESAKSIAEKVEAIKDRLVVTPRVEIAPQVPQGKSESAPVQDVKGIEREMKRKEGRELFASISVPERTRDGFFQKSTRRTQMEQGDTRGALVGALNDERKVNDTRREKFFMGAVGTGLAAIVAGGAAGGIAGSLGITAFGYAGGALIGAGLATGAAVAAPILGVGAMGWAGLKIYHGLKQRAHRKKFNKIYDTGRELSTYDAYYS